jgi:small-conductance mechanosensitive channel
VGEAVKVGNDIGGKVVSMGWFDTLIRRPNESVIIIPNGQMMTSTITNLSRQSWGQYKTEVIGISPLPSHICFVGLG